MFLPVVTATQSRLPSILVSRASLRSWPQQCSSGCRARGACWHANLTMPLVSLVPGITLEGRAAERPLYPLRPGPIASCASPLTEPAPSALEHFPSLSSRLWSQGFAVYSLSARGSLPSPVSAWLLTPLPLAQRCVLTEVFSHRKVDPSYPVSVLVSV